MKSPVLLKIAFVFFATVAGIFVGMLIAPFFIPDGAGLAGAASVLMYGLLAGLIVLIASIVAARHLSRKHTTTLMVIAAVFDIIMFAWIGYRINTNTTEASPAIPRPVAATPAPTTTVQPAALSPADTLELNIGIGVAKPFIELDRTLPLYSQPAEAALRDSVVFGKALYGVDVTYAPEWFYPEVMKVDYGLMFMHVTGQTELFYEVEVNRNLFERGWVKKVDVEFLGWESFFVSVHSVEQLDPSGNPIRLGPSAESATVDLPGTEFILQPKEINGEWMRVDVYNYDYDPVGAGWLRWRDGRELVISYALLS